MPPQSSRETPVDVDDAHLVAVLLAEEHHRAELARLVDRDDVRPHRVVLEDRLVDPLLDRAPLVGRERLRVGEVEAQLVGAHRRAGLVDVVAEHVAERPVQQMRGRVVGRRREPHAPGHDRRARGRRRRSPRPRTGAPGRPRAGRRRAASPASRSSLDDLAGVADLAAALRVERRLAQLGEEEAVAELLERADLGEHLGLLPADELGLEARRARELGRALRLALRRRRRARSRAGPPSAARSPPRRPACPRSRASSSVSSIGKP